jgi:hypothetical protein
MPMDRHSLVSSNYLTYELVTTTIERPANETLLNLFEYLDDVDLHRASHRAVLHSTCRQHLPLVADRLIALHLSNSDDPLHQVNLFLSDARMLTERIDCSSSTEPADLSILHD